MYFYTALQTQSCTSPKSSKDGKQLNTPFGEGEGGGVARDGGGCERLRLHWVKQMAEIFPRLDEAGGHEGADERRKSDP